MSLINKLSTALGVKKREAQILVVGLDNGGKSTILNKLKPPETQATEIKTTVGFNVERLQHKLLNIVAFDMSGQGRYRNLWEQYYRDAHGIMFVVDASDRLRLAVAKDELWQLLEHADLCSRTVPLLLLANKTDERGALSAIEVSQALCLDRVKGKPWHISACSAHSPDTLHDGIDWLCAQVKQKLEAT